MFRDVKRVISLFLAAAICIVLGNVGAMPTLAAEDTGIESSAQATSNAVQFVNGDFSEPSISGEQDFSQLNVTGWHVEKAGIDTGSHITLNRLSDGQSAALNAAADYLCQTFETTPGEQIYYEFYHRGYTGDAANFYLYAAGGSLNAPMQTCVSSGGNWVKYSGVYTVPDGQTRTTAAFNSLSSAGGTEQFGNFISNVKILSSSSLTFEKRIERSTNSTDASHDFNYLTYTFLVANTGGTATSNTVLTDTLPKGMIFVEESIKIDGNPAGDLGVYDFDSETLRVNIGEIPAGKTVTVTYDGRIASNTILGSKAVLTYASPDFEGSGNKESTVEAETAEYNFPVTQATSANSTMRVYGSSNDDGPIAALATITVPATLTAAKWAEPSGDNHAINLMLQGTPQEEIDSMTTPQDIVIIVDISGSVDGVSGYPNIWPEIVQSLNEMVEKLLPDGSQNRIGIVVFGDMLQKGNYYHHGAKMLGSGMYSSTQRNTLKGLYNTSTAGVLADQYEIGRGTCMQLGFYKAHNMLQQYMRPSPDVQKHVVFLTDGEATGIVDRPSSKAAQLSIPDVTLYANNNGVVSYEYVEGDAARVAQAQNKAIEAAGYIKTDFPGVTVHSVGFTSSAAPLSFLVQLASTPSNAYRPPIGQLAQALLDIANRITYATVEHKDVTITDPMSQYVTYENNLKFWSSPKGLDDWVQIYPAAADYQVPAAANNWTLTWNIANFTSNLTYKVTYDVRIKQEHEGKRIHRSNTLASSNTPGTDGVYANDETYIDSDLVDEREIPVPAIFKDYSFVSFNIRKYIDKASDIDEQFVFKIEYRKTAGDPVSKTFYAIATIPKGGLSQAVSVTNVAAGHYTITEIDSNWRYTLAAPASGIYSQSITNPNSQPTFYYVNRYDNDKWLGGKASVKNQMQSQP